MKLWASYGHLWDMDCGKKKSPRTEMCRSMSYMVWGKRGFYKGDWKAVFRSIGGVLRESKRERGI